MNTCTHICIHIKNKNEHIKCKSPKSMFSGIFKFTVIYTLENKFTTVIQ